MVTIIVKDSDTDQEMILSISKNNDETATVKVRFNPPYEKQKTYPELWDVMAGRVMNVIKTD